MTDKKTVSFNVSLNERIRGYRIIDSVSYCYTTVAVVDGEIPKKGRDFSVYMNTSVSAQANYTEFMTFLRSLDGSDKITVYINNYGGQYTQASN